MSENQTQVGHQGATKRILMPSRRTAPELPGAEQSGDMRTDVASATSASWHLAQEELDA